LKYQSIDHNWKYKLKRKKLVSGFKKLKGLLPQESEPIGANFPSPQLVQLEILPAAEDESTGQRVHPLSSSLKYPAIQLLQVVPSLHVSHPSTQPGEMIKCF